MNIGKYRYFLNHVDRKCKLLSLTSTQGGGGRAGWGRIVGGGGASPPATNRKPVHGPELPPEAGDTRPDGLLLLGTFMTETCLVVNGEEVCFLFTLLNVLLKRVTQGKSILDLFQVLYSCCLAIGSHAEVGSLLTLHWQAFQSNATVRHGRNEHSKMSLFELIWNIQYRRMINLWNTFAYVSDQEFHLRLARHLLYCGAK